MSPKCSTSTRLRAIEHAPLPLAADAGDEVAAQANRAEATSMRHERVVEELASLGVVGVDPRGQRNGVLHPHLPDVLGQEVLDGREEAAIDLVLESTRMLSTEGSSWR